MHFTISPHFTMVTPQDNANATLYEGLNPEKYSYKIRFVNPFTY